MFGEYLRRRGSRKKGAATLKSDTITAYVGLIKKLRSHEAHHAVTDACVNTLAPAAYKRMRQLDGTPGERQLCLGLRARHLRLVAQAGLHSRTTKQGKIEWGAALLAHNLLLRGGELGVVDRKTFNIARDITIGAVQFRSPCAESQGMPWLTLQTCTNIFIFV